MFVRSSGSPIRSSRRSGGPARRVESLPPHCWRRLAWSHPNAGPGHSPWHLWASYRSETGRRVCERHGGRDLRGPPSDSPLSSKVRLPPITKTVTVQTLRGPRSSRHTCISARSAPGRSGMRSVRGHDRPVEAALPKGPTPSSGSSSGVSSRTTSYTTFPRRRSSRSAPSLRPSLGGTTPRHFGPGNAVGPAIHSLTRGCGSCGQRVGCTTVFEWS